MSLWLVFSLCACGVSSSPCHHSTPHQSLHSVPLHPQTALLKVTLHLTLWTLGSCQRAWHWSSYLTWKSPSFRASEHHSLFYSPLQWCLCCFPLPGLWAYYLSGWCHLNPWLRSPCCWLLPPLLNSSFRYSPASWTWMSQNNSRSTNSKLGAFLYEPALVHKEHHWWKARNLDMTLTTISLLSAPPAPPLPPRHPCSPRSHPVCQASGDIAFWSWLPLSPLPHPPTLSSWMDNYSSCRPPMRHDFFQEALPVSTSVLAHRWGCTTLQKAVLIRWLCTVHSLSNPPWKPRSPSAWRFYPVTALAVQCFLSMASSLCVSSMWEACGLSSIVVCWAFSMNLEHSRHSVLIGWQVDDWSCKWRKVTTSYLSGQAFAHTRSWVLVFGCSLIWF